MTIRHIRIFEAVCDAGYNTTRAAEALHMTQPAVSLAISELESYYGVLLFDRIARRLHLTEAGREFLDYARRITLTFDDMEKTVRSWESKGILRVGASISVGAKLMPELVARFRGIAPDIRVKVKIDRSDRLEEAIAAGDIDLALIEGIAHDPNLMVEDFMEDRLALIASPDTVKPGKAVTRADFAGMEFLLRERGSGTREIFESTLAAAAMPLPDPAWESLSTAALMNAAEAGLGVAVVPRRMAEEMIAAGRVAEFFVEGLTFRRTYKIVWHRDKKFTRAARDFIALCRDGGDPDKRKDN